jgi:AmmeMemoRadiSam system protein B
VIRWGVVSHHLLVRDLIAEYFLRLSSLVHPATVVLMGPNHYMRGNAPIAVSRLPWKTPFGLLNTDTRIIDDLIHKGLAVVDEDAFYNEHSVGALVPFIRFCFPGAAVVTIVVRPDVDTCTSGKLARYVASNSSPAVLFLASLDFSHYRTSGVAETEDSITYGVLSRFELSRAREAFVDSHVIFRTIIESCILLDAREITMIHHTNSGELEHNPALPCTSYMNMILSQDAR